MAKLALEHLTKDFGNVRAVNDVSLEVEDGEFLVILGPSGAGKTTTLKLIAGVERPTSGMIYIGGKPMNAIEPHHRNVAMAFESYALYPHYNVRDNLSFPLKAPGRKFSQQEITRRVEEVAELLNIAPLLDRLPRMLSNGQKQRVALGRAMVREPDVLLLDEPISHLDAKLRHRMRTEFKALEAAIRATTIYVTHDYLEAMSLADRLVVLKEGTIQQSGGPHELFVNPANVFVAQLLGHPQINLVECTLQRTNGALQLVSTDGAIKLEVPERLRGALENAGIDQVIAGIRPQHLGVVDDHRPASNVFTGTVYVYERLGTKGTLTATVGAHRLDVLTSIEESFAIDEPVSLTIDPAQLSLFDAKTHKNILFN
ncbi:MAG: ABC transporter ATP-binding protein [Anaerolineae bacterium]|nr:ABC transporter ATP-binding protein [Anaerolineae bacterium]